jgi:hypothetical protein
MKKIITLLLILCTTISIIAQVIQQEPSNCNFIPTSSMLSTANYSNRYTSTFDNGEKFIFNVKFHAVFGDNSENIYNVNEDFFLNMIAKINIALNQYNIFFKYRGYNSIEDNSFCYASNGYSSIQFQQLKDRFVQEGKYDNQSINVFVPNSICSSDLTTSDISDIMINPINYINNQFAKKNNFIHGIAHRFGLLHVYQGTNWYQQINTDIPSCIANSSLPISLKYITKPVIFNYLYPSENVTRDIQSPNYNAHIAGDHVEDTEACFQSMYRNFCPITSDNTPIFTLDGRVKDQFNEVYVNLQNIYANYMFEIYDREMNFTAGQVTRMRESIANDADGVYTQRLNLLPNGTANVYPLYEPFQRSTTVTGIVSTYDNGDGTARVCRGYVDSGFRFQPGFDYQFPDDYDEPTTFTAYSTSVTPLLNPVFNCPVRVLQVSNDLLQVPTTCRGQVCIEEPFDHGIRYSTQVLGSMNMTQEDLDIIEVKDPNLYNNLMSQYYHILKKFTASGAEVKEVFFKQ